MQALASIIHVARSYDHTADHHDHPANTLWDRVGRQLVARAGVASGMRVLDAGCGSGASAIPAAQRVGRDGAVIGVDLSPRLLAIGRARAMALRLRHLRFVRDDLRSPPVPDQSQDVVLSALTLHLLPSPAEGLEALWRALRAGGTLALALHGRAPYAPAHEMLMGALRSVGAGPGLPSLWDRLAEPTDVRALFAHAGLPEPEIQVVSGSHPLADPEAWWMLVLGSEYRWFIDQLPAEQREHVRRETLARLEREAIGSVRTEVQYVTVRKA
jgi:ubiquinone/menaquinone biosynthesis C-methylase UbiE